MNIFNYLFDATNGRTTFFLLFFTIFGSILQWWHRLDYTFITFACAIMAYVLGHSIKDDIVKAKS